MEEVDARKHSQAVYALISGKTDGPLDEAQDRAEWLKQSWLRSVERHKLDPGCASRRYVRSSVEIREASDRVDSLRAIARPYLDDLYRHVSVANYCVVMTDADGLTLDLKSAQEFGAILKGAGVRVGTVWSEEHEGTCGVGTAIADRRPTLVHKSEHFRVDNIGLSCSAAPIFDLEDRLVAILDAGTLNSPNGRDCHALVFEMVSDKALAIENAYVSYLLRGYWRLTLGRQPSYRAAHQDWLLAFDSAGVVVGANRPAREALLSRYPGRRALRIDDVLETTADELIASARRQPSLALPVRLSASHELFFGVLESPERSNGASVGATPREGRPAEDELASLASNDPKMLSNAKLARRLADKRISIMLRGETGTGKEVFARAIHSCSSRRDKSFVAINCAAVPETLIESELFGYREGAFTGAKAQGTRGKLLQASGGTLFLDEIGDMPLALQSRLLRVLAEREVVPLGAEAPVSIDLHVICASHRDLLAMVGEGSFREDLYYRLNGACIELPPLRSRSDIGAIILSVLAEEAELAGRGHLELAFDAMNRLKTNEWPGNIRQLRNALRYACAVCESNRITVDSLPADLSAAVAKQAVSTSSLPSGRAHPASRREEASEELRAQMMEALAVEGWKAEAAAVRIGMARSTFYRKMLALGIKTGG